MKRAGLAALTVWLVACGGGGGWTAQRFRSAAEQQIRRDSHTDEVICETPATVEAGQVFACRAPYTSDRGVAWNDYNVTIIGRSDFVVSAAGGFDGV